jgi:hypothetical protein
LPKKVFSENPAPRRCEEPLGFLRASAFLHAGNVGYSAGFIVYEHEGTSIVSSRKACSTEATDMLPSLSGFSRVTS